MSKRNTPPPTLLSGRTDGEPFEWFDDCAVCQYMKKMEEEGREPTEEELQAAFRLARMQGAPVGGSLVDDEPDEESPTIPG